VSGLPCGVCRAGCWTNSSDISGYHADFHEGHGTVGAGQESSIGMCELTHGMAGERHGNGMGAALARHAMCESAYTLPTELTISNGQVLHSRRTCPFVKAHFL
jgi:hypothetical protein